MGKIGNNLVVNAINATYINWTGVFRLVRNSFIQVNDFFNEFAQLYIEYLACVVLRKIRFFRKAKTVKAEERNTPL